MKLLFTKNNLPLSRLIRWAFGETCSHFAIAFDNRVVFHSNLKGCHVEWLASFLKCSSVVYEIPLNATLDQEESVYQECLKVDGKAYDFGAFLFLCLDVILFKLFKIPLQNRNLFASPNSFICVELAECLKPVMKIPENLSATSPYNLYLALYKEAYESKGVL
jgi:hypothetical protein